MPVASKRPASRRAAVMRSLETRRLFGGNPFTLGAEHVFTGDAAPDLSVGGQAGPSIASGPDGVSLAVWHDARSSGPSQIQQGPAQGTLLDVYAARVRADGSLVDATPIPVAVNSYDQWMPEVAWNGTNWLVSWRSELDLDRDEEEIRAVRVSPEGVVLDATPLLIGTSVADPGSSNDIDPEGPLGVASDGVDWIVTWKRYNPATSGGLGYDWFGTKVLADGTAAAGGERIYFSGSTDNDDFGLAFSPVNGGQYLQASNAYNNSTIRIRRLDRDLNLIAGSARLLAGANFRNQTSESIAGAPDGWALAWRQETSFNGVQAIRVNAAGDFADAAPLNVSPNQPGGNFTTDVTWTGTDYAIAYSAYPPSGGGDLDLYVRRLPAVGPFAGPTATLIADPSHQSDPTIVGDGAGGAKAIYIDQQSTVPGVAAAVISPANALVARADVALSAPSQSAADLFSDGANFLNVFSSSTAYGARLLAQRITPAGVTLDAEPIVVDDLTTAVRSYEIVFHADRYTIFWQNFDAVIRARTVTTAGVVGPVVEVMATTAGVGFNLDNASVNGDRVIVAGNSGEGTTSLSTRFARVFDAIMLAPLTARFEIGNTFALSGGDAEPFGPDRWILAWPKKANRNASVTTVRYAVVNADGTIFQEQTQSAGNTSPIIVTNGGVVATEAMVVSIDNNVRIQGSRVSAATGDLLTFQTPLIEAAGLRAGVAGNYDGTNYVLTWTDQRNYPFPARARDDVFAARVAVDGTVLDPGGVPVADSFRPEAQADVAVAGGQVVFVYRTFRSESPYGSYRLAARGMDVADPTPPALRVAPAFAFETSQSVAFEFDKPLQDVEAGDLLLVNQTSGVTIAASNLRVSMTPASGASGWTYRWAYADGSPLPDGQYLATLPAGSVRDLGGVPTEADSTASFAVLGGDADRDGTVGFGDLLILAQSYGQAGRTFSQGNFDYSPDGVIGFADLLLLASRYGQTLPPLAAAAGSPSRAGVSNRVAAGIFAREDPAKLNRRLVRPHGPEPRCRPLS